ncbi:MAG: pimeloyl-ACP methyl ester carboxylesterase [Patiriisocius sp.]|jgi:pimeloyl-ACP methyl ester carboxylesterase
MNKRIYLRTLRMRILKGIGLFLLIVLIAAAAFLYKGEIPKDVVDAKYSSPTSQFLTMNNGARVHFRDEGNPNGPVMVLIHGSNASLHTWQPWLTEFESSYRVVTLDLPGHGLTGGVPDGDYSSAGQLNTVAAVVDHLGLERFVLGGNSMGGGVTWRYALEHQDQVEAMILVDASGPPAWWQERREAQSDDKEPPLVFTLLGKPWFRAIARHIDPYQLTVQGLNSAYNSSPVVDQALIDRYYEISLREGTRDATMSRFGSRRSSDETIDLSVLAQPTLVMWGREDSLISVDMANKFAEAMPNTTVVIYDDVGHIPMEEIPIRSAQDVLKFLSSLESNEP